MKKLLTLVLVAVVLFGVFGAMLAKARAQEPGDDYDHEPPEPPEQPEENEQTPSGGENVLGGETSGGLSITVIAGVLVGVIVVVALLAVAFHKAASGQSTDIF